jgi:monooxygenase
MAVEQLDVVVIGAGISGLDAAHHVKNDCQGATFAVLERRASHGGTWDLMRYPGIRSDSDMFTFGYDFHPWSVVPPWLGMIRCAVVGL